jgi:hypothetical protein
MGGWVFGERAGETVSSPTELSVMLWQRRVLESQQESSMVETAAVVFW